MGTYNCLCVFADASVNILSTPKRRKYISNLEVSSFFHRWQKSRKPVRSSTSGVKVVESFAWMFHRLNGVSHI